MGTTTSHELNTNTMASADEKCTPPSVMDFPDDGAKQHVLKGNTQRNGPAGLSAARQRDTTRSLSACPPHPLVQSHPHATPLPSGERAEDSAMDEVAAEAEAKADETTTMPAEPTTSSADAAAKAEVDREVKSICTSAKWPKYLHLREAIFEVKSQYDYDILVRRGVLTSSLRKSDAATVAARRTPPDARVVDWDCTPPNLDTGKGLGENATSDASQVPTGELGTCNTLPALLMERSLPTPRCPWSRPRCPQPPTCTAQQRTPANSHSHHHSSSCP